jgi:hypothetical protein
MGVGLPFAPRPRLREVSLLVTRGVVPVVVDGNDDNDDSDIDSELPSMDLTTNNSRRTVAVRTQATTFLPRYY